MPIHPSEFGPSRILPIGTKVVLHTSGEDAAGPSGAVGVIVAAPLDATHAYRVRLVDGDEVSVTRGGFALLKEMQSAGYLASDGCQPNVSLDRHVILRCVVGSRAYGLEHDQSDTDIRGVYLPPADARWSLFGVPEQLESDETQECYWELQKFLVLALKANPNILECLHSPLVMFASELGRELLAMRRAFVSRLIYQTYNGYVLSQFKKLEQDLRVRGELRWKHAMHLIRLLLAGVHGLQTGEIPVRVGAHRERLLDIKRGVVSWDEVNRWRIALHQEFDEAARRTELPERPDYATVDAFLIRARRWSVDHGG
ncbi:MAG: DNA polymerase beta superfamily protein [Phycisphaerae bacterium]